MSRVESETINSYFIAKIPNGKVGHLYVEAGMRCGVFCVVPAYVASMQRYAADGTKCARSKPRAANNSLPNAASARLYRCTVKRTHIRLYCEKSVL